MRVSTSQLFSQGISAILDQQSQAARSQMELSSGKRILSPSDDPSGMKTVLDLGKAIDLTTQYQRNADSAQARLSIEDSTLSSATDLLQRARELAVQGNNGSQTAESRKGIATEVRQLVDGMLSLANTKDANGEYLFAGYKTQQQPFTDNGAGGYTYTGDQGQRTVQVGPSRQVATSDSGSGVFMNVPGSSQSVFGTLYKMATDLEANTPTPATIDDIDAAIKNIANVRSRVGARLNAIDDQRNLNASNLLQFQQARSSVEDVDVAKAVSDLQQHLTGLQAAQQSYVKIQGLSLFNYL
jgi:flagellar hook-associated protein 3 FlgL